MEFCIVIYEGTESLQIKYKKREFRGTHGMREIPLLNISEHMKNCNTLVMSK